MSKPSAQVLEDRFKIVVLTHVVSYTGKYYCFFGQHFNGKQYCYDVGAYNNVTGETVRRHYQSKDEAMACWQEFREGMVKPKEGEEYERPEYFILGPNARPVKPN